MEARRTRPRGDEFGKIVSAYDVIRSANALLFDPCAECNVFVKLNTGKVVVDGGFGHNNPTKVVIEEARRIYGDGVRFPLLLSIGTGLKQKVTLKNFRGISSVWSLIRTLADRTTATNPIHEEVTAMFKKTDLGTYLRIDIPGIGHFALDDFEAIPEFISITKDYLNSPEGLEVREAVVKTLLGNQIPPPAPTVAPSEQRQRMD